MVDTGLGSNPTRKTSDEVKLSSSFPLAAYLRFCPGGISYAASKTLNDEDESLMVPDQPCSDDYYFINSLGVPSNLIFNAREADDRLRQYTIFYSHVLTLCLSLLSACCIS